MGCLSGFDVWRLFALIGWLLVGIASSIGFGIGIPTRVLFVWPHVLRVAAVESDPLTAWVAVLPVCVTHALGSALGELPPFLGASMLVQRFRLNQESTAMAVSHRWFVERMQSHGWFWVFVLAAWPNVAFDCAGLAAGASGMSLFGFLSAAVCGKAVVRASGGRCAGRRVHPQRVVASRVDDELGVALRVRVVSPPWHMLDVLRGGSLVRVHVVVHGRGGGGGAAAAARVKINDYHSDFFLLLGNAQTLHQIDDGALLLFLALCRCFGADHCGALLLAPRQLAVELSF